MPKIEVNEEVFYTLAGRRWDTQEAFEEALTCAKAELDSDLQSAADGDKSPIPQEKIIKIELNDTNRPDLWGTAGCARQLRVYDGKAIPDYRFFSGKFRGPGSTPNNNTNREAITIIDAKYKVHVEKSVQKVRPYITGFIATGKAVSDPLLRDMIQTQEKLAWNFGRKRRTISMGVYRTSKIKWPVIYRGADPDSVSFVPLQWDTELTLREILKQHPKGKEYAFILEKENTYPLLSDSEGSVLSFPPIINSADIGAVVVGDTDLFVEITGGDQNLVTLAASIVACDMADNGFTVQPIEINYEFETPFGQKCVTPYYFQEPVFCSLGRIKKFLGELISADDCVKALKRMGVRAESTEDIERGGNEEFGALPKTSDPRHSHNFLPGVRAWPPEYRNDFLHAADVMEDIMIGRGLSTFKPERPRDFTVGRLTPLTVFCRRIKEIMAGMGYQEMIYNYLGSRKDLVQKMRGTGSRIIQISNPMTENYEYVRDSILPSLMESESVSGNAPYPHRIFETGKVAFLENDSNDTSKDESPRENYGSKTRSYLGFIHAGTDTNFNTISAELQTLFYYLSREYDVEESNDSRFIDGRAAAIVYHGRQIGVFGEIHPEVLENWGIAIPCTACEIDAEALLEK